MPASTELVEAFSLPTFQQQFYRTFKYIAPFVENHTYSTGQIVEYEFEKYKATANYTSESLPTDTDSWEKITRVQNEVFEADLNNAKQKAEMIFHQNFFQKKPISQQLFAFNLLIMHYTSIELQTLDILDANNIGITSSASLSGNGGVSESWVIPKWVESDSIANELTKTPFGKEYIMLCQNGKEKVGIVFDRVPNVIVN